MKLFVFVTLIVTFVWAIDGAAIDTDEVKSVDEAPVVPVEDINEDCNQPKITGRCYALFHRYAYNVENRACEHFIYGGCGGNTNNFESKEECEIKCAGKKAEDASPTEVVPTHQTSNDKAETKDF